MNVNLLVVKENSWCGSMLLIVINVMNTTVKTNTLKCKNDPNKTHNIDRTTQKLY